MSKTVIKTNDALDLVRWGLASRNQKVHNSALSLYSYSVLQLKLFEFVVPKALAWHYEILSDYNSNKHLGLYEIDMEKEEDDEQHDDRPADGVDITTPTDAA